MVKKADQERVKTLLKDTITLLCRNGLTFKSKFSIEALIGVTLDDEDVFLVSINELIKSEKAHNKALSSSNIRSNHNDSDKKATKSSSKEKPKEKSKEVERKPDKEQPPRKRKIQEVKSEDDSFSDDYDDPEEGEIRLPLAGVHGNMMRHWQNRPDQIAYKRNMNDEMWDEEEDEEDTHTSSYEDSNSQSFKARMETMHKKRDSGNPQQMSPVKPTRVKPQPRIQPPLENSEVVFIKEEPNDEDEDSWPPPDEDDLDEHEMYQNMGSVPNSCYRNDQNFQHLSGMNMGHGGPQDENAMMSVASQGMDQQQWQHHMRHYRGNRTATVTSEQGQHPKQQHQESGEMPRPHGIDMPHNQDLIQQDEIDEENCFYAVYDDEEYDEMDEEMQQELDEEMQQEMKHDTQQDLKQELGTQVMPSPNSTKSKKQRNEAPGVVQTMYVCQICAKSFTSLNNYNTHKDEHKGIFKHSCNECGKGFPNKTQYDTHMRHHTGERFKCPWCGKAFMSKTGMKRHAKNTHGADTLESQ